MPHYESTGHYRLIYVFSIPDANHEGFLKIGKTEFDSTLGPSQIEPNCDILNAAAHKRISEYTKTAMVPYELLYTELAARIITMGDGFRKLEPFDDHDIHCVLDRAGYLCKKFYDTGRDSEWYQVNLQTVINAIHAYKEGRVDLTAAEKASPPTGSAKDIKQGITLRAEQQEAIEKTLSVFKKSNKMLWDCKMRFGKTVSAYELIRRAGFQKTIVVTHRPVVEEGWQKDHDLIFGTDNPHLFVTKKINSSDYEFDRAIDSENERLLRNYAEQGIPFAYFASMQDLRGSKAVKGKYDKNNAVFELDWDCIIYDEAHEGTQTELGQNVQKLLEAPKNGKTPKVLSLSGTPYNLLGQYEENVYTWDYVMEQRRKKEFAEQHPDEYNPYANLPEMRILTFDLHESMPTAYRYETADMAFNFREFFRTWTGDPKQDFRPLPPNAHIGDFVHEQDVNSFLDLITHEDESTNYPFANEQYRNMFRHTFWMVPGVKEARALSALLQNHAVFSKFKIANVAGEGDQEEAYDDALKKVQTAIRENPYTITISCGRLTTGVTVPEWSAVMMLSGSSSTSAAGYMQTIFRVQSVGSIDGKQKEIAYVFDFAPDRALTVLTEVHSLSKRSKGSDEDAKAALDEFTNFCPVISVSGTKMTVLDAHKMMRQMKKITVDKAIKSGFDDESIYNEGVGIVMDENDVKLFNHLASVIHGQSKAKLPNKVTINQQGLTNEQYDIAEKAKNKPKRERTKGEQAAIEKLKEQKKEQEKVIRLLRAVSIRLPMLIYGAKKDLNEGIRLHDFIDFVDDESWKEFMPENVGKDLFKRLLKYYDEDVVVGAGLRIRRMARAADELPPTQRVKRIAEIFALFRNPDKETVLTPWRVVNMHMGDCIGGYNFYEEGYPQDGLLETPRLIENDDVTTDIFLNPDARILEMNSKSGLYPLYLTYSLYALKLDKPDNLLPLEETQRLWQETLSENIFVLCKTKMAVSITRRTLAGYRDDWTVNAVYLSKLLDRMADKARLTNKLTNPVTWGKDGERMKFDAVVGNPPYQQETNSSSRQATPVYNHFVEQAKSLQPRYISMIMPSRWFAGGMGLDDFRRDMMNDSHLSALFDYVNAKDCFPQISISGGVCYFLWVENNTTGCRFTSICNGRKSMINRPLNEFDVLVRYNEAISIIHKTKCLTETSFDTIVSPLMPFGLSTNFRGSKIKTSDINLTLHASDGISYIKPEDISKGTEFLDKYKVLMSKTSAEHAGEPGKDGSFKVFTSSMKTIGPNEVCTHSYFIIGRFDTSNEADNVLTYLKTKFVRFLVLLSLSAINLSKLVFTFVPIQDFSKPWTDTELYEKYGLTEEEIAFIEGMIKPME